MTDRLLWSIVAAIQWGTVGEWVAGIAAAVVAGVLGWFAVTESKKANQLAKIAVELAEANRPVKFEVKALSQLSILGDGEYVAAIISVGVPKDAPPVWLHGGESRVGWFTHETDIRVAMADTGTELEPVGNVELPAFLNTGQSVAFEMPWPTYPLAPADLMRGAFAQVNLRYSLSESSPVRAIPIEVVLPERPGPKSTSF